MVRYNDLHPGLKLPASVLVDWKRQEGAWDDREASDEGLEDAG